MKCAKTISRTTLLAAAITLALQAAPLLAQHVPAAHRSLDAVTVLPATPTTAPAATAAIPAGHPQINGNPGDPSAAMHAGMASAKSGAFRVIVSQGTKMGPPIGKDPVRVDLLSQGVPIKTYHTVVDDKGIIELHDLPLDVPFQPVISVLHEGAEQQRVGAVIHKYQPAIEFDMPVYEVTTEKPAWTIGLRDIEATVLISDANSTETFVRFTDMIGAFNPAGRAWVGETFGDTRLTLAIQLPPTASNVQFGPGMAEAGAKVVNNKVVRGKTMVPGSTQYVFAYDIPVKVGKATVTFTAPADTTLFALYIPVEWTIGKTIGLEVSTSGGTHAAGKAQLLKAKALKAGDVLSVELSGINAKPSSTTKPTEADHTTDLQLPQKSGK